MRMPGAEADAVAAAALLAAVGVYDVRLAWPCLEMQHALKRGHGAGAHHRGGHQT